MSDPHGHPVPDAVETDPAALSSSEDLDEDRLRVDPLEEGVEPPEQYMHSDRFGTTPNEEYEGESLDDRLREERPDVQPEDADQRPPADDEFDEAIDDFEGRPETLVPEGPVGGSPVEEDQNADKAGGSVAETIRTPPRAPE
ncbi:MAG TPA: hypothetical protein VHC18_22150 [Amycolatopsis sp.]|nr:hypothetical protein [Amycolatopsis sp.]